MGHPQLTSTELVKPFIVNEPVAIQNPATQLSQTISSFKPRFFSTNTISSQAAQRSVFQKDDQKNKKNEIFVDVFEKISVISYSYKHSPHPNRKVLF
jgi:hypothetical protein